MIIMFCPILWKFWWSIKKTLLGGEIKGDAVEEDHSSASCTKMPDVVLMVMTMVVLMLMVLNLESWWWWWYWRKWSLSCLMYQECHVSHFGTVGCILWQWWTVSFSDDVLWTTKCWQLSSSFIIIIIIITIICLKTVIVAMAWLSLCQEYLVSHPFNTPAIAPAAEIWWWSSWWS